MKNRRKQLRKMLKEQRMGTVDRESVTEGGIPDALIALALWNKNFALAERLEKKNEFNLTGKITP